MKTEIAKRGLGEKVSLFSAKNEERTIPLKADDIEEDIQLLEPVFLIKDLVAEGEINVHFNIYTNGFDDYERK